MKLRYAIIFAIIALALSACTLAADITPPPGYVAPTPMPTLGPLFPSQVPDIHNGAAIYIEKCAACHGDTGLGDGAEGKQLPVTVAAFALPETARKASPAQWFTAVTQGNLDRFMPPFASLDAQERWNVVSYVLTLHTTNKQVEDGKALFESECAGCANKFKDQKRMAELSESDIINIIKNGEGDIPAFGKDFTDEQAIATAIYIRKLTFATPPVAPTVAPATETPVAAEAGTPSVVEMPTEGTTQAQVTTEATAVAGTGIVRGIVDNQTGKALPADVIVTLHAFEHGSDPTAGPKEVFSAATTLQANGTYSFENVEVIESRIYLSELQFEGANIQSEYSVGEAGATEVTLPTIVLHGTSTDTSLLSIKDASMFFNFTGDGNAQVFVVYTLVNSTDKTIFVSMGDAQEIPFIKLPSGSTEIGYEATQDSASFISTDDGFGMPPSETPYGIIAFATLPKSDKIEQPFILPVGIVNVFLPEGVTAEGDKLTDQGVKDMQGTKFQHYTTESLKAGNKLTFSTSGEPIIPAASEPAAPASKNQTLLIGIGVFGVALIIAGVWMYLRDRNRPDEDEDEPDEFASSEDVMDAMLALDDL
ncbi:MAG: cytochrome c, partial [Anaerolineales bacterium]|nr:cytochrome c [Anaerolineales bacterium]